MRTLLAHTALASLFFAFNGFQVAGAQEVAPDSDLTRAVAERALASAALPEPAATSLTDTQLIDQPVYNADGRQIGIIKAVEIDDSGERRVVIELNRPADSVAGDVRIPLRVIEVGDNGRLILSLTAKSRSN